MSSNLDHDRYMQRAISLAANVPARPFAAVIVDQASREIVAEGWNKSELNPTWHGEIDAINRLAASPTKTSSLRLALYTTAEPCPMCQAAILWSGIETVIFGTSISQLQQLGWKQMDITAEEVVRRSPAFTCEVIGGILEEQCYALFAAASGKLIKPAK